MMKGGSITKPLYNNYVRQPVGIFVVQLIVVLATTITLIYLCVDNEINSATPVEFQCETILPEKYEFINSSVVIYEEDLEYWVYKSALEDAERLYEKVMNQETLHAMIPADDAAPYFDVWELSDVNGITYVSVERTEEAARESNIRIYAISTTVVVIIWGFFLGSTYVLYNAPRYPRLAKLLIRKEFRNF